MEEKRDEEMKVMEIKKDEVEVSTGRKGHMRIKLGTVPMICITMLLAVCILVAGLIGYRRTPNSNSMTATGSASTDFESDIIVWGGTFNVHGETTQRAYKDIQKNADLVKKYLLDNGINEEEFTFNAVSINKRWVERYDNEGNYVGDEENGYDLSQSFTIQSENLDKVSSISRDISELIASGVELESQQPEYYVSRERLDEIKMQLIADASENARQRIDAMAGSAGARAGKLTSANLGVFQITAYNSGTDSYSYDGSYDTSSRFKTAMITVKLNYQVK